VALFLRKQVQLKKIEDSSKDFQQKTPLNYEEKDDARNLGWGM